MVEDICLVIKQTRLMELFAILCLVGLLSACSPLPSTSLPIGPACSGCVPKVISVYSDSIGHNAKGNDVENNLSAQFGTFGYPDGHQSIGLYVFTTGNEVYAFDYFMYSPFYRSGLKNGTLYNITIYNLGNETVKIFSGKQTVPIWYVKSVEEVK